MSQPTPAPSSASPPVLKDVPMNKLMDLIPKSVTSADCLSPGQVAVLWDKLYTESGLKTASETKKASFRMWLYVTCAINGTSRVGTYNTVDTLSDGTTVHASVISRVLRRDIRKFLRSNMPEATEFLKSTGVMESFPRFVSKANGLGGNANEAWAMADWMSDNPAFTTGEANLHAASFRASIARARRVRGGSLEDKEALERAADVRANGADLDTLGRHEVVEF